MSSQDSAVVVTNFINLWATEQLLVSGAKRNLTESKQEAFNKLAMEYKNDLYSKAYLEALVAKNIDTVVSIEEMEAYYNDKDRKSTRLNSSHVRISYAVFCLKKK